MEAIKLNSSTILNSGNTTINNLIIKNFSKLGLTTDELLIYLNLRMYQERGILFPETNDLIINTGFSQDKVYQLVQSLVDKKIIKIISQSNQNDKLSDYYDLTPIFSKLINESKKNKQQTNSQKNHVNAADIFQKIEVEFGRPLSPIEQQTINEWITKDHYSPEIISLALKEAVLNQAYSLKYMDRILINWEKRNIKTPEQLQRNKERYGEY